VTAAAGAAGAGAEVPAIRDVVLRYCSGIDRLDADLMKSAYWPDATDDHGTFVGNGWEFVDRCMRSHARWRATMHCVLNHRVDLDASGTSARGEVYHVTYLFPPDTSGVHQWCGRYLDAYERRDGQWRIRHRVCVHEGTVVLAGPPMPIPEQQFRSGSFDRPSAGRPIGP